MFNFKRKLNGYELDANKLQVIRLFNDDKFLEVIILCDQLLGFNPGDQDILYYKARALMELEKYNEALSLFNEVLKKQPNNLDFLECKAKALMRLEVFPLQEVKIVLNKIRDIDSSNAYICYVDEICASYGIFPQTKQGIEDERYENYLRAREQIEKMPIYERWRKDVLKKCGNKCQLDKAHADRCVEVHHIDSLYSIYKENNLISNEEIIKCKKLWDIDNGIVLCKECHDTMESSKKRQSLMTNTSKEI